MFSVQYKVVDIPYPKDKDKVKEQIDAEEKEAVGIHLTVTDVLALCVSVLLQFC